MQQRVKNMQETVNNRFKFWGILSQRYRHDITRHGEVFFSIVVITQLVIIMGEALFSCGYKDPPYQQIVDYVPVVEDDDLSYDDDNAMSHWLYLLWWVFVFIILISGSLSSINTRIDFLSESNGRRGGYILYVGWNEIKKVV